MKFKSVISLAAVCLFSTAIAGADAVADLTAAAELGDADAQMKLGSLYVVGQQVRKNNAEAAKWFLKAAEAGSPSAQCQLARMHMTGSGVAKDDVAAYKWASLAATHGDASAKGVLLFLHKRMKPEQVAMAQGQAKQMLAQKAASLPPAPAVPAVPVEPAPPVRE